MSRRLTEVVVTLFVLAGIGLAVFAYFWFSGRLVAGRRQIVRVYFDDVTGLRLGDPVDVLGITKGKVKAITLEGNRVRVDAAIDQDVVLTADTRFAIRSVSYLGSDRFLMVTPGTGAPVGRGAVFNGENQALDLEATFLKVDKILQSLDPTALGDELRATRDELLKIVRRQFTSLDTGITTMCSELRRLGDGFDQLSARLDSSPTLRRLIGSAELYDEVRETNRQLQALITDFKARPERYIRLRLF
ncbi:MAG: MlaD family protein [candidate division WOR-3 bacterium]